MLIYCQKRLMQDSFVKIDLLTLFLALLFVIGLLAIDSVRATQLDLIAESPLAAGSEKPHQVKAGTSKRTKPEALCTPQSC